MAVGSSRLFLLIPPILLQFHLTIAQPDPLQNPLLNLCSKTGNFTSNSTYKTNLDHLLTSLTSNSDINYGFYNSSFGENKDQVNAIALCRGDSLPVVCRNCIQNAQQVLRQQCLNQKEAVIWYDDCMVRYSDRYIFGNMEFGPYFSMYNLINVTNLDQFSQALSALLTNLTNIASSGDSRFKFAVGNTTTTSGDTIYALVQCTPDLSKLECFNCLDNSMQLLPQCCTGRIGGRIYSPSCQFRYEKEMFYDPAAVPSLPSSAVPPPLPVVSTPPPSPKQATSVADPPASTASISGKASNIYVTFGTFLILIWGLARLQA